MVNIVWCRKISVEVERRFEKLSVVPVYMAGGGELEGSWLGMLL